jgi:hypothetical protein
VLTPPSHLLAAVHPGCASAGFGRIGRNFLRCLEGRTDSLLEVIAINDSGGVKQVGSPRSLLCWPRAWDCSCTGGMDMNCAVCLLGFVLGCGLRQLVLGSLCQGVLGKGCARLALVMRLGWQLWGLSAAPVL